MHRTISACYGVSTRLDLFTSQLLHLGIVFCGFLMLAFKAQFVFVSIFSFEMDSREIVVVGPLFWMRLLSFLMSVKEKKEMKFHITEATQNSDIFY